MSININSFVPDSKIFDAVKSASASDTSDSSQGSFLDVLKTKMDDVNTKQVDSENATQSFISGDSDVTVDQVMLSGEEAKQSLQLALQVRNKIMDAYTELNKTQI